MFFLVKIKNGLDRILEFLLITVFFLLVVAVVWQVYTRYVPWMAPSDWTQELATFLMIWIGLLGASVALRRRAHLGIDYFVNKLPPKGLLATEIFGYIAIAFFSVTVLLVGGSQMVRQVLETGQSSPALGLPMAAVYGALPVSGFFLTLYSLALLYETILRARGRRVEEKNDAGVSETVD